ncbi:ABC transporter permease [Paenibacillus sp. GCM10027627]|uniref:ABC transporter permease n=1 Tax=unclassified Paenibacillus TaxID=185978 RepID=UPI0036388E65
MTFSMRRVYAILQKDYKDISRNMFVFVTLFLPLLMAAFYGRMGETTVYADYMIINMTFVLVGAYVQSSLIAEEKEKNTLRGLTLSPASTLEIFLGKSLLSFIATAVVVVASMLLLDYSPQNVPAVAIALIVSTAFYLAIGTLIGLYTKSVMEASVAILPVVGVFTFGSALLPFIEQFPVLSVLEYMPNMQLLDLAVQVEAGAGFADVAVNLLIILAWAVVMNALSVYVYKRRMVDE